MKHEVLSDALDQIRDKHISDAARRRKFFWIPAAAAAAAIILLVGIVFHPFTASVKAVSLASEPRIMAFPDYDKYKDKDQWRADIDRRTAELQQRRETTERALADLTDFFAAGSQQFLTGSEENRLWSPVNAYLGLAMLTELTEGDSRQQLLTLLGCEDTDTLRSQTSAIWESAYNGDKHESSTLANSLWLRKDLTYKQDTMDALSYHYYASVYQGALGTPEVNQKIGSWLNENTGGLLKSATDSIALPENSVFALYSTLFFQSKWVEEFRSANNTDGIFHAPGGDKTVTYMNKDLAMMNYYWGDTYGAVSLSLKNGSRMWFILPDEGLTPEDVLQDGQYLQMLLGNPSEENGDNVKFMKVNLSVPKFDVTESQNLKEGLQAMGVTDVFSPDQADFSGITADVPVYITAANQAVRIQVDEQGVKAAAYIELPGATSPMPPDEIIDFILNRPFLFVLTKDNVPLVSGVIRTP